MADEQIPGIEPDDAIGLVLHRLRTPLTALKGWAEIAHRDARSGTPSKDLIPALELIVRSSLQLQREIDVLAAEARARLDIPPSTSERRREPVQALERTRRPAEQTSPLRRA
ncbi:MAG TPA: hypothetical protein VF157_03445 [Chloroflexota bacterium]